MKSEIISQYKASLKMLFNIIELCPDSLWNSKEHKNPFWRIVYHTLYFTALYLSKSPKDFLEWSKHIENYDNLGKFTHDNKPILINNIYSKGDLTKYLQTIIGQVEKSIDRMEEKRRSEFHWIPGTELERHLYNTRHIQHHTGQLVERLHSNGIEGINWEVAG